MENYIVNDRRRQILMILTIAVSVVMFTLDYSMVNISLPTIAQALNMKLASITWLPLIYLLIVTSSLLCFGKLGDVIGYKKVFISGLSILLVGTFLCGIVSDMKWLLASRALQSLGEAMLSPVGIAMLTTFLPADRIGRALGVVAMSQGIGLCLGPVIGSYIVSHINWHAIFFLNIPFGILVIIASLKVLPEKQPLSADKSFDILGAVLIFSTVSTLLFALNSFSKLGLKNPVIISCLAVSVVSFVLFLLQEKKVKFPLVDFALFKNKDFTFSNLATFFAIFVYMGFYFLFPFYMEYVRKTKISEAGMLLMIPPILMMLLSPLSGRLSDKIGSRLPSSVGMALALGGFIMYSSFNAETGIHLIMIAQVIMGSAMGVFLAPNNKLVMNHAPAEKQGVASGVYKTTLSMGSILGIAILPVILMSSAMRCAASLNIPMAEIKNSLPVIMAGFRQVFLAGIVVCIAALAFSILAKDKKG